MKRFLAKTMCIVFILCLMACGNTANDKAGTTFSEPVNSVEQTKNENKSNADILGDELVDKETDTASGEKREMKLFITAAILFCIMVPIPGHIPGLVRWIYRNRK